MANTPPAILGSLLITGASIADNMNTEVPSGVVRAYDLVTGDLEWAWEPLLEVPDSGNHSGHREGIPRGTYIKGTSNVWSFISVDTALGLVYVPTGNTSPDYYGGHREGSDFYSSSVVALDAKNGKIRWHFQTVHHDIWDFDVPSQPTLFDYKKNGKLIRGLAQTTKQGLRISPESRDRGALISRQ